jgi:L-asparaginase / beta-aspartyl-peptidase
MSPLADQVLKGGQTMRRLGYFLACILLIVPAVSADDPAAADPVVLVMHGGAVSAVQDTSAAIVKHRCADLQTALRAGHQALEKTGGTSLDAVEAAIRVLEDSGHFNAGKGAVFNRDGRNELNSSIMDGRDKRAGAIAGICRVKNPISAARAVMEKSPHVLLIGESAERFARTVGLDMVNPLYFWTEESWKELKETEASHQRRAPTKGALGPAPQTRHFGTVGAVALDRQGNLAAGTSTGGITYVYPGRVGDSPIIGAGTYAENESCAISCTGHGELFIRYTVAGDIAARMKYRKDPLQKAVDEVLAGLPKERGGVGGIIALDRGGRPAMAFNTPAMYRATVTRSGKVHVAVKMD